MDLKIKNIRSLKRDIRKFCKKNVDIEMAFNEVVTSFCEYDYYEIGSHYSKDGKPHVLTPSEIYITKNNEITQIKIIY